MPVLTNIFLVEGLQERRGEGRRELEWRRWTGPADALQAALAVLLAAGFPALFEHHSEEDVAASMLVAGENDDGGGDDDDGVQLPTSITVPRLWVFGAPTLLEGFLHHAMLHPFVSLQEDERGMWGGDSDDQATERLVVSLQRLLEGRLVTKGFERTEDGFVCPSLLPARRDGASAASSAIVCRIEAFSYGDRLGFYCSVGVRAAARSLNLRSSSPEEDERSRFDGAATTSRHARRQIGGAAVSRAARHSDSEHSTPHAVSSSDFLAQVLIDQLGFNASASEEEEWTAPRPWASSALTSPASAQDAMDMEGAGLDSLEDRLAGKRTRATDASLLSPFADVVGDSRSAKRSRPQEPSPLGGPLYASPTGGILSPAVTTASPLPDAAALVKDEPAAAAAAPVPVPPPAAAATKAGKEDDAWYLLNDDSNDIDIDFESLIRSLSTEDSANAAAAAAAVAAAAIMPPEPAVKPEPTATVMAPGALASPFDQFADAGAAAARDATAAAAAALLEGGGPEDAMILTGISMSSSAPSPLAAAATTPTSISEADVIASLEEPSSTQPDQAGERLLLHVWPTGYSPLPIPPTPPNARYSYRPTSQLSPSARVDSPSPAPPLSFRWWKRISESSSSSSSSSAITSSSTPSTSATTATAAAATWSAAASAALSSTPLLKSEVDDLLSPKSNGFVSSSSTSLSEADEAEPKARLTEEIDDIGPELDALIVREVVMQQCSSTFDMLFLGISPSGLSLLDDSGGSVGSGSGGGPSTAWFMPTPANNASSALRRSSGGDADTTLDGAEVDPLFALVQQYSKDRAVAAQARSQLTAEGLMHALATVGQALNGHTQHQLQHHAVEADSFATGGLSVVGPLSLAQWNQEERAELEELAPPSLVVGFRDEWLNIPPTAIRLWEKALLEPYAPRKNVAFYALVPNDPLMSRALPGFLRDLTAAYQTANLGAHEPAIEDNIRWVELSDVEAAMRSYRKAAKDLAQELLRQWRSGSYQTQAEGSVVVYVVDPGPLAPAGAAPTAPQELLRCAVPLLRAAKDLPHLNIAFQILPTALLLEPWTGPSLRDLAFSVFSKCRRMSSPHSSEKLYEPVYVLAAPEPDASTTFVLHVAYSSSSTPQVPLLVIATLTDARGEMRQSLYLDSTHALAQLWQCALMAIARVSATWRIVIGKLGQLAAAEAQEWEGLVASWRAGGARAGRARVASVAVVQVTPHPHLHLLPALGSDLLPDLSASASQGSSSQGGSDGDPPVEVSTHAHRSLELELFDAWRTSSSLHLGNSYLLPRPPPAPGSVGALADPTAAAPMASVALLNPSLSQFHVRWPAGTATLVISLVALTDLQWSGEPQQHQAEAVLREVGRDYHRLSWLTLSSATGRRLSPLPLHFLAPAASSSSSSSSPSCVS